MERFKEENKKMLKEENFWGETIGISPENDARKWFICVLFSLGFIFLVLVL